MSLKLGPIYLQPAPLGAAAPLGGLGAAAPLGGLGAAPAANPFGGAAAPFGSNSSPLLYYSQADTKVYEPEIRARLEPLQIYVKLLFLNSNLLLRPYTLNPKP